MRSDTWTAPEPVTPAEVLAATEGALFPDVPLFTPPVPAR